MGENYCEIDCTKGFNKKSELFFYRLPKAKEKRRKWIAAIRRNIWKTGTKRGFAVDILCPRMLEFWVKSCLKLYIVLTTFIQCNCELSASIKKHHDDEPFVLQSNRERLDCVS